MKSIDTQTQGLQYQDWGLYAWQNLIVRPCSYLLWLVGLSQSQIEAQRINASSDLKCLTDRKVISIATGSADTHKEEEPIPAWALEAEGVEYDDNFNFQPIDNLARNSFMRHKLAGAQGLDGADLSAETVVRSLKKKGYQSFFFPRADGNCFVSSALVHLILKSVDDQLLQLKLESFLNTPWEEIQRLSLADGRRFVDLCKMSEQDWQGASNHLFGNSIKDLFIERDMYQRSIKIGRALLFLVSRDCGSEQLKEELAKLQSYIGDNALNNICNSLNINNPSLYAITKYGDIALSLEQEGQEDGSLFLLVVDHYIYLKKAKA